MVSDCTAEEHDWRESNRVMDNAAARGDFSAYMNERKNNVRAVRAMLTRITAENAEREAVFRELAPADIKDLSDAAEMMTEAEFPNTLQRWLAPKLARAIAALTTARPYVERSEG